MIRMAFAIIFATLITFEDAECKYLLVEVEDDSQTPPPISPMATTMPPLQTTTMNQTTECYTNRDCLKTERCIDNQCTKGICRNHEEHCGFQSFNPPKNHGKCCGELICEYKGVGGAGKCVKALNECKNKPCGEPCSNGICSGKGYCTAVWTNPCVVHGCDGKKCGESCILGDIGGVCTIDLKCEIYDRRVECEPRSICCPHDTLDCRACHNGLSNEDYCKKLPEPSAERICSSQHSPFDCTGKKCGDMCEIAFSSRTGRTGERDMGTCNNLGNCLKIFEPNCDLECRSNAMCKKGEICINNKCAPHPRFSCTGKKCGDACSIRGEKDEGKCNDQGNCQLSFPFEPSCANAIQGKQCVSEKKSESPWDICNSCHCVNGCTTRLCTKAGCHVGKKGENQLCNIERSNCDEGLKCMKQDDGCNNGIGRCVKSGYKPRQYGQGGSYNNGYVGKYNNGQGGSYNDGKQEERYNPWQA